MIKIKQSAQELKLDLCNMRSENIEQVISKFVNRITELHGDKIADIYLYGSVARGNYRDDSDIDIFVTMNTDEDEIDRIYLNIWQDGILGSICLDNGVILSYLLGTKENFDNDKSYLYVNIKKDGVRIV